MPDGGEAVKPGGQIVLNVGIARRVAEEIREDFDGVRVEEQDILEREGYTSLLMSMRELFGHAVADYGLENGYRVMAGALFASRLLRQCAEASGMKLPNVPYEQVGVQLRKARSRSYDKYAYAEFRSEFSQYGDFIEAVESFTSPFSKAGAATILVTHQDLLVTAPTTPVTSTIEEPREVTPEPTTEVNPPPAIE